MFIYLHFSKTIHRRSRRPFFVHLFFFFTLTLCQIVPNLALTRSARTPGILSPTPLMLIMQCLSRTMYRVLQSLPLESELYPLLCCDPSLKIMLQMSAVAQRFGFLLLLFSFFLKKKKKKQFGEPMFFHSECLHEFLTEAFRCCHNIENMSLVS